MPSYAIRLTCSYTFATTLFDDDLGLNTGEGVVVYQHDASRIHIHIAIKDTPLGIEALKQRIKKKGYTFDRGDWSFKTWDGSEQFLVYMTKGTLAPSFIRGWTQEQAQDWATRWTEPSPPPDRWQALYSLFENELKISPLIIDPLIDASRHDIQAVKEQYMDCVIKKIRSWCFKHHHNLWTPICRMEYQFLISTYALRNSLDCKNLRF